MKNKRKVWMLMIVLMIQMIAMVIVSTNTVSADYEPMVEEGNGVFVYGNLTGRNLDDVQFDNYNLTVNSFTAVMTYEYWRLFPYKKITTFEQRFENQSGQWDGRVISYAIAIYDPDDKLEAEDFSLYVNGVPVVSDPNQQYVTYAGDGDYPAFYIYKWSDFSVDVQNDTYILFEIVVDGDIGGNEDFFWLIDNGPSGEGAYLDDVSMDYFRGGQSNTADGQYTLSQEALMFMYGEEDGGTGPFWGTPWSEFAVNTTAVDEGGETEYEDNQYYWLDNTDDDFDGTSYSCNVNGVIKMHGVQGYGDSSIWELYVMDPSTNVVAYDFGGFTDGSTGIVSLNFYIDAEERGAGTYNISLYDGNDLYDSLEFTVTACSSDYVPDVGTVGNYTLNVTRAGNIQGSTYDLGSSEFVVVKHGAPLGQMYSVVVESNENGVYRDSLFMGTGNWSESNVVFLPDVSGMWYVSVVNETNNVTMKSRMFLAGFYNETENAIYELYMVDDDYDVCVGNYEYYQINAQEECSIKIIVNGGEPEYIHNAVGRTRKILFDRIGTWTMYLVREVDGGYEKISNGIIVTVTDCEEVVEVTDYVENDMLTLLRDNTIAAVILCLAVGALFSVFAGPIAFLLSSGSMVTIFSIPEIGVFPAELIIIMVVAIIGLVVISGRGG